MDYTGAFFSQDGTSVTGRLANTRFTPTCPTVDGATAAGINQKLDRLLSISTAHAAELTEAKSSQLSMEAEILQLTEKVRGLEQQIDKKIQGSTGGNIKIPRYVSVSLIW